MATWHTARYPGVRFREHSSRRHGPRLDRYFAIKYPLHGKVKWEVVGWASQGVSASQCHEIRATLLQNQRMGSGPLTLAELREDQVRAKAEEVGRTLTFQDLARDYLAWATQSKKSWAEDQARLRDHILPIIGPMTLASITRTTVSDLQTTIQRKISPRTGKPLAPATILQCLALVRSVFNFGLDTPASPSTPHIMAFAGPNPARLSRKKGRGVKIPTVDNRRLRVFTPDELEKFFSAARNISQEVADICRLSLDTGMRRGEILVLSAQHVTEDGAIRILDPKGGRSRTVYPKATRDMVLDRKGRDQAYLFPGVDGGQRDHDAVTRTVARIIDAAGLNHGVTDRRLRAVFHTFRHTYATRLYVQTRDLHLVQRLLGHQHISTTEVYVHLAGELLARLARESGEV